MGSTLCVHTYHKCYRKLYVKDHEMQGGTRDQRIIQNAFEHLESVACDCVLVLMTVLT